MTSPLSSPKTFSNPTFLESARPVIQEGLREYLIPDLIRIIEGYAVKGKAFGAEDWKRYYNVEVEDLQLGAEFYDWWWQKDAGDSTQLNCETHLPPILCPETILEPQSLERTDYCLETLERLVENPKKGHLSKIIGWQKKFIKELKAGPSCYIVARKELFARNLTTLGQREYMNALNAETHAGYDLFPRAIHVATVALVHYTVTGDRYLGDRTGMEQRWSYGRCEEIRETSRDLNDIYRFAVGGQRIVCDPEGIEDCFNAININNERDLVSNDNFGVVGLRKFGKLRN